MEMEIVEDGPRGRKRKADEAQLATGGMPRRIKALEQDVVNKIAAGEIIVAPVHALKELIENAVDAGSTSIEIVIKDGGLKLIQITDNGHGINREDLPILCERFTTSKLKAFEDLTKIGTYGFRGEALASISHIAHLTVTTKTKESNCAWRAHYADGKLVPAKPGQSSDPKATAGRGGTQITIEDLFYNVPTRRRAFRSASEEYSKILNMIGRYAVHRAGVSFSCKKHGDSSMAISVPGNAKIIDRIRQIHGGGVANELVHFETTDGRLGFNVNGYATNANYHVKRTLLLLFINHRAVESSAIKKAIEQCYSAFLPKGGHPFIYMSLDIDPERLDVNVHPTKREVNFLNEDEIIQVICDVIRSKLTTVDTSRTFTTQSLLPGSRLPLTSDHSSESRRTSVQKPSENNLIRTDSKLRKITSMLPPNSLSRDNTTGDNPTVEPTYEYTDKSFVPCRLTTVRELRAEVRDSIHNGLTDMIASHTFVGIVDEQKRILAIQGGVKLYLVDYGLLCHNLFYQLALTSFSNLGTIRLNPPLPLLSLLTLALSHQPCTPPLSATTLASTLQTHSPMLTEYFSLTITSTHDLATLPLLLRGFTPSLAKLPRFLLRIATAVDFHDEKACFRSFLTELAAFYAPECLPPPPLPKSQSQSLPQPQSQLDQNPLDNNETELLLQRRRDELAWQIEHVVLPAVSQRLVGTRGMVEEGGVVEVANLRGLYRVFERC